MKHQPNLEAVVNFGVGYDAFDVAQANKRSIPISNTPDVLADCVAEIALGLCLSTLRSLGAAEHFVRDGTWATGASFPLATHASGKCVGILGLGSDTHETRAEMAALTLDNLRRYISSAELVTPVSYPLLCLHPARLSARTSKHKSEPEVGQPRRHANKIPQSACVTSSQLIL